MANAKGSQVNVTDLLEKAEELRVEREGTLEAQAANREILRYLDKSGMLSAEESESLEYYYPVRSRNRTAEGDEAGVADGE